MVLSLERYSAQYQVFAYGHTDLDITDVSQVAKIFEQVKPDVVIHTAAYTQVDQAETDCGRAYAVNALGTRNLVVETEKVGAKFVYISTITYLTDKRELPIANLIELIHRVSMANRNGLEKSLCSPFQASILL